MGIDGDWMTSYIPEKTSFYPTDHCGVLRVISSKVNPKYMEHILKQEGIKAGFSRAYRASLDRIQGITFAVADIRIQDETVAKVQGLEARINEAEGRLKSLRGEIHKIIHRYLG